MNDRAPSGSPPGLGDIWDGASGSSSSEGADTGRWRLETRDGATHLMFDWSDGTVGDWTMQYLNNQFLANGSRVSLSADRPNL